MTIKIVERDKKLKENLRGQFGNILKEAILVNLDNGFEVLLKNVQTGRPVIAYGEDPHTLGDSRFLGIFKQHRNITYLTFPLCGWDAFLRAHKDLAQALAPKRHAS